MRMQFIEAEHEHSPERDGFEIRLPGAYPEIQKQCPWAAVIQPVAGGYQCFESVDDWEMWRWQSGFRGAEDLDAWWRRAGRGGW